MSKLLGGEYSQKAGGRCGGTKYVLRQKVTSPGRKGAEGDPMEWWSREHALCQWVIPL